MHAHAMAPALARIKRGRALALAAVAFAAICCSFATRIGATEATHSDSMIGLLALDAKDAGNDATSLGSLDGCARVEVGADLNVDYVVDAVPQDRPMIAFEAEIRYDPQLLEVVAGDNNFLLGSTGAYSPFAGRSNNLPDTDGSLLLSVLDTASQPEVRDPETGEITKPEANVERGKGVLARITFRAKATGVSEVGIAVQPESELYPFVLDTQNEVVLGERLGAISLAVAQDCPPEAIEPRFTDLAAANEQVKVRESQNTPTPTGGTDSPTENAARDSDTPPPIPISTPCIVQETPSPAADGRASPTPGPAGTPQGSPTPAPCTPSPSPVQEDIVEGEGSETPLIVAGAILLGLGTASVGGGWYLYRRSRSPRPE